MFRRVGTLLLAALVLGAIAVGIVLSLTADDDTASPPLPDTRRRTSIANDVAVRLPPEWHRGTPNPSRGDPIERLTAGTGALTRNGICGGMSGLLEALSSEDALVIVVEYSADYPGDFPPRPDSFEPGPGLLPQADLFDCVSGPADFRADAPVFSDNGRRFSALVVLGLEVSAAREAEAYRVLDSLRVSSSTPTTVDTKPADPAPQAPEPGLPQGTFQAFLDRAPSDPDGTRHVSITLPNGQTVPLRVAQEGLSVVGGMFFEETAYMSCPSAPSCGDAEPKAYPTEELPPGQILQTFSGGDTQPVLLVEHPFGRALRWIRSGWTIDVLLNSGTIYPRQRVNIPESAYQRWISGLIPFVDDQGWIELRTSNGLALGVGGGFSPTASLYSGREAMVNLITGTTCNPANDEDSVVGDLRYASRCHPDSGILLNAQGNPDNVQFLLSVLSVG